MRTSLGRFSHGSSWRSRAPWRALQQPVPVLGGRGAQGPWSDGPFAQGSSGLGTISSSSTSSRVPMPLQAEHAPKGLLKEKDRGSISSMASGCSLGQARFSEKARDAVGSSASRSTNSARTRPSARPRAVSTGVSEPLADAFLDHQAVNHHLDGVLELLAELGRIAQLDQVAVDPGAGVALGCQLLEEIHELALAAAHHGARTWKRVPVLQFQELVHDLLRRLLGLTGSPQTGQCGRPTRAHSRRM
jgi:hypothetical protein